MAESNTIFVGLKLLSSELIRNTAGMPVRIMYMVVAMPRVEPLLIPGMWLLPKDSFDSLANPLVQDLQ
jgi:hypothetical protein